MIMGKRFIMIFAALCTAIILIMPLTATYVKADASYALAKSVDAGATWVVMDTTKLAVLRIAEGAIIKAPEGYSVTMTVDGVETGMNPGFYRGKIVLTLTENITVPASTFGSSSTYNFRTAIDIENGAYVPKKSVAAAVKDGTVTDSSAKDVKITSNGEKFNGIIVKGDSESSYSIINPEIQLTGNGENDFVGYAAAIMSSGNAEVTVENARIINTGAARTAVWVGGNSTMHVNNSYIEVHNGTLPADYTFNVEPGRMWEVPWVMGIVGNLRATNLAENGTVYYNNTHIKAQGWGCLSTDAVTNTRLFATDCLIETIESGYGAFSLGGNINTFSGCTFNVADIGMVSQDGDGVFTDGTVVNSGRFGVMYFGSGDNLTIEKGSVFNTKSTAIQLKSSGHNIVVDNAKLNPGNGIILQVMATDDPYMAGMSGGGRGGGMPPGGGMPGGTGGSGGRGAGAPPQGGMPGGTGGEGGRGGGMPPQGGMPSGTGGGQGGAPPDGGMPGGAPQGGMPGGTGGGQGGGAPGGGMQGGDSGSSDVNATFKKVNLKGDIINGDTPSADLNVTLEKATITGAITSAVVKHALGPNGEEVTLEHPELYYLVGEVSNTYCATTEKYGVTVSLDKRSKWVVDKTSYLTGLTIAKGAAIKAPKGHSVTMTVDGVKTPVAAGSYEGDIVLTVTSGH